MSEASQARFELPRQQIRHLLLLLVSTWRRGATGATTLRTGHLRLLLLLVGTGETPRCVFSRCRRRRPRASRRWCRGPRAAHTQISARAHKCQFISLLLHQTLLCARNPELGTQIPSVTRVTSVRANTSARARTNAQVVTSVMWKEMGESSRSSHWL